MKITFVSGGDWQGLYVDGKIVLQNHSLYPIEVLEALKIDFDYIETDDEWLYKIGRFPDELSKVKKQK